jgi:hypothetical protein
MTFVDAIAATVIIVVFLIAFSQALLPVHLAWEKVEAEYRAAETLRFIAESFKNECAKPDRNMENWKKAIRAAKELESLELTEMWEGEELRAIRARCFIGGEYIDIIGLCIP